MLESVDIPLGCYEGLRIYLAGVDYSIRLFGFLSNYFAFTYFVFKRTWLCLSQKRVVCTKFDIYVFIFLLFLECVILQLRRFLV